jgi:hypothetical protein
LYRLGAKVFNVKRTREWSEKRPDRLLTSVLIWLGILETKMSNMSRRFITDVGHYVGPGGAIMERFLMREICFREMSLELLE